MITHTKKPSILVPFPHASADHQNKNASFLQTKGVASVLEERYLTPHKFLEEIEFLMEDKKARSEMIENMGKYFEYNSAKLIAKEVLSLVK